MGEPSGASRNPEKPWERPWSLEEMRQSAGNWSLAGDAGMLLYLQGFSQRMIAKTHAAQAQVNGLLSDVKLADVQIQNSFNDFIMLANTQFVENRVYDEDVTQESTSQAEPKEDKAKTKEDREAELVPKISQALGLGLQVIDNAFEKLDISEANSDSEDDDSPYKVEPLLEPKDPYITRPLPFLIGSQAFLQDDHVGLVDIPSDEEQDDQGTISDSESSESEDSEVESDEDEEEDRKPSLPRQPVMRSSGSESEGSGDLFDNKKSEEEYSESDKEEEEEEVPKNRGPANFTDELAAKLTTHDENDNQQPEKPQKERKKSKSKHKNVEEPDLFSTEPPDDDEDSLFSKTGGLFSASKGLFDDEEEGPGLFGDVKKPATNKVPQTKTAEKEKVENSEKNNRSQTKGGKKLPTGAVSIFGDDNDLFGSNEREELPAPKSSQPAAPKQTKATKPSGGLFDGSDEDDLFAPPPLDAPTNNKPVSQTKKTIDLFMDDDEEEDDLFANPPSVKVTDHSKKSREAQEKVMPPAQQKKLPAGAVSIFGGGVNPLSAAIKSQRLASPEEEESSDEKSMTSTTSSSMGPRPPPLDKEPSPAPSSNSLFAEEPEDDLFSSKPSAPKNKTKSTISKGLFEDEDEDLFTPTPTNKPKLPTEKKPSAAKVFEDEDETDDLFGNLSVPPPAQPAKKKPVGGVSIFGDSDIFSSSTKPTTTAPKEPEKPAEPVVTKAKRVSLFDEDEEEDLFGSAKKSNEGEKSSKETKPAKKPGATKGLFEDDDLFGGQAQEAPSVDLFGPSSPIKQQKTNPLADEIDNSSVLPDKESMEPPKSALLLKGATITASSTDLFGEMEDEGDLFATPSSTKKADPLAVPGATTTESSSDSGSPRKTEVAASSEQPKKPVGGVSLFGGLDLSSALKKGKVAPDAEKEQSKNELFKGSPDSEDNLFAKPKSAFRPPPSDKPVERVTPPSVKSTTISSRPSNVGKLKLNLAIDPTALLPGAKRPSEETTSKSVGFDDPPAVAETLYSAQKSRAKIQSKRRPPTRKHLLTNAIENADDNLFSAAQNADDLIERNGADRLSNSSANTASWPTATQKSNESPMDISPLKMNGATSDSSSMTDSFSTSSKSTMSPKKEEFMNEEPDDLFGSVPSAKPKDSSKESSKSRKPVEDTFDDIFGDSSLLKKPQKKAAQFGDDIFSSIPKKSAAEKEVSNEDDIFSSEVLKPKKSKKAVVPLLDDDDDIFKTLPSKSLPAKPKPTIEDEDDIFASATKSQSSRRPKKAMTNDEDIFSDNTDIFADITTVKKDKKLAKSANLASGDSLFKDADMEDIFASAKSSRKSSTQLTKKKLDPGESSIFDDPLSAATD